MSDYFDSDDEYTGEEYQDYEDSADRYSDDNLYVDFMFPVLFLIRTTFYAEPYPEPELFYPEPEPYPDDWHTILQPYVNVSIDYPYDWYARRLNRRMVNESTIEPDSEPPYGIAYNSTVEPQSEPACDSLVEYFYDDGPFADYSNSYYVNDEPYYNNESCYNNEYEDDWAFE